MALQMIWTPLMTWMQICQVFLFLLQCWLTPIIRWVLRDVLGLWQCWCGREWSVFIHGLKVVIRRAALISNIVLELTRRSRSNLIGIYYWEEIFDLHIFIFKIFISFGPVFTLWCSLPELIGPENGPGKGCLKSFLCQCQQYLSFGASTETIILPMPLTETFYDKGLLLSQQICPPVADSCCLRWRG